MYTVYSHYPRDGSRDDVIWLVNVAVVAGKLSVPYYHISLSSYVENGKTDTDVVYHFSDDGSEKR